MSVIWKYELPFKTTEVSTPEGAKVVSLGPQAGYPCIWMRVPDPEAPKVCRQFVLMATGEQFADYASFVYGGTIIMGEPSHLVWHVFEDRTGQQDPNNEH